MPDVAFTHAVEDGFQRRLNAKKSWAHHFFQEILEAAKQGIHHRYIAFAEYLTRIAYHLIGAIDLLPEPFHPIQRVAGLTSPPTKAKKIKKAEPQRSASSMPSEYRSDSDEPSSPIAELRGRMQNLEDRLKQGIQPTTSSKREAVEDSGITLLSVQNALTILPSPPPTPPLPHKFAL